MCGGNKGALRQQWPCDKAQGPRLGIAVVYQGWRPEGLLSSRVGSSQQTEAADVVGSFISRQLLMSAGEHNHF